MYYAQPLGISLLYSFLYLMPTVIWLLNKGRGRPQLEKVVAANLIWIEGRLDLFGKVFTRGVP